jgi:hypothetical protein
METETKKYKIEIFAENELEENKLEYISESKESGEYIIWQCELYALYSKNQYLNGLDLSSITLEETLEWLKKEGYKEIKNINIDQSKNVPNKIAVLCLLDIDSYIDEEETHKLIRTFNQFEYELNYYDSREYSSDFIGCIFCGGMYTALMEYENGIPLIYFNDKVNITIPKGNTPINYKQLGNYTIGSLLLLARKYSENSPFYKDYFPLDMFKIIFKFSDLF